MVPIKKKERPHSRARAVGPGHFVKLTVERDLWVKVTSKFKNGNFKGTVIQDASSVMDKVRFGKCHIQEVIE